MIGSDSRSTLRLALLTLLFALPTLLLALSAPAFAAGDAHVALVIGSNVGDPHEAPLRYAIDDARRVAEVLLDAADAQVIIAEEPSIAELDRRLAEVIQQVAQLRSAGKRVFITIYYAGHADREAFHLDGAHYPIARLQKGMRKVRAQVRILVTDACRTNQGLKSRGLHRLEGQDANAIVMPSAHGQVWIHAASLGEAAQESDRLRGGVFTHFWVSALRGAADANEDGMVTLGEAYAYAASHTHGFSASSERAPQWPEYTYRLSGSRDVVLTRTHEAPSLVRLPAGRDTTYVLRRWPSGATVVQVNAKPHQAVQVAMPAGRFEVIRRGPKGLARSRVHLPWGGQKELRATDFTSMAPSSSVARGGERAAQFWLGVVGGLVVESDLPLIWQRLEAVALFRFGGHQQRWVLTGRLGWQGYDFDLQTQGHHVRSDSLLLSVGAAAGFDAGPVLLTLGPRLQLEWMFQREYRDDPERYEAASIGDPPTRQTLRAAGLLEATAVLPVVGSFWWLFAIGGGAVLQPASDGDTEVVPLLQLSTGPAFSW